MKQLAPYGLWTSPLHETHLTEGQKRLGTILIQDGSIYWDEGRPQEKGRVALMEKAPDGTVIDHTGGSMSCRTRVHEYGGKCFAVANKKVYFVNDTDQRIYAEGNPLTEPGMRCADFVIHEDYLIGVGEKEGNNFLFSLHLPSGAFYQVASGHDFYASPTPSPCGNQIAYLTWDHPHMPWESSQLWLGSLKEGRIVSSKLIAGGENISIQQPLFSSDGVLHCISDESGWWNIYQYIHEKWIPLHQEAREFGLPLWQLGLSTYTFCQNQLIAASQKEGLFTLLNVTTQETLTLPWTFYTQLRSEGSTLVFIAASATEGKSLIRYDLLTQKMETITKEQEVFLDQEMISLPQMISFPSHQGRACHGIYYPPQNALWRAPLDTAPPLLVISHGGPTSQAFPLFDLKIQFWTSRGFAVIDVNYGGSSGYGRAYRNSLQGEWGVMDTQDCEAAAQFLIKHQLVDPKYIAIRGSSAGGYTTLAALTSSPIFTAGASYYGVSDLKLLAKETHKFEAHYLDFLLAPYLSHQKLYEERSPLHQIQGIKCPIIFFQGEEDTVVPPNQARLMHEALKHQGIKTKLILYPHEQHGFRQAKNIQDSLAQELNFYLTVWGLKP
ncbi:alpha/beta hydrolase family protein [Rhabdochlamydiaceae symbiont of Dictyostelium giganteum]|uniref:alpha/beta hydrolase family protein n=1 Tax=Rhabdochlamydiaceae symbiont of Dictyostelium giganteum TaxID=3342349 RepID=UPI00384D11B1